MKFQLENGSNRYRIASYAPGAIRVNETTFTRSFILTSETLVTESTPASLSALAPEHMQQLLELEPEVVLLGSGARQVFPDQRVLAPLLTHGIGIEVMSTGAACRTFNILSAEGRRVAAILFMIESGSD